ncbi:MAG: lamin tail domain-containing protein, partial [Anaerolineales bacterium]|nr:lamin tail domain-containing protein [Anaerolineales bacterium]
MRLKTITLTLLLAMLTLACSDANNSLLPATSSPDETTAAPETDTPAESETETPSVSQETEVPAAESAVDTDVSGEEALTTPEVVIPHPVINEVVIGIEGNNNHEFIELYNPTAEPVDLKGWSLWYQLRADENPVPLYRWETRTDLPAHGYYLLGREGIDLGVLADATFNESLFNKGGLFLRDAERQDVDVVGWGDAPAEAVMGSPAPAVENGQSLLRQPDSYAQDNAADFAISDISIPQNSGAPLNFAGMAANLAIVLPQTVAPGEEFDLIFIISNEDPVNEQEIFLSLYIPEGFEPVDAGTELTEDRRLEGSQIVPADSSGSYELTVIAPFTYSDNIFNGSYIEVNGHRLYALISNVTIAGGSVPIGTARELIGQTVTIEGTATMYTDGFYAGSTGTKFYIEDETGGIQVYVPDGMDDVNIVLGDRVKVSGEIEPYRTALEIIPADFTTDIEVVGTAEAPVKPAPVAIAALVPDNEYIGQLVEISGVATRIEEFSFSYEVDLTDEAGNTARIYLDKLTNATTEPLVVGESYAIAGIAEMYDGNVQLQPRQQSDLVQVFPPTLRVEVEAPLTVVSGTVSYMMRVINNTEMTLNNIIVSTDVPMGAVGTIDLGDDRVATQETIKWSVPSLAAGEQIDISYEVSLADGERIEFAAVTATADEWPEAAVSPTAVTYVGDIIPIYALQGAGFSSPYVGKTVTTEGLITAVFPELGGFWMQTPTADDNPATSEGIFVLTDGLTAAVSAGESVRITGKIRELSGQTTLQPATTDGIANV